MADAAEDLDAVELEVHPWRAPVAEAAAGELVADAVEVGWYSGGEAVKDADEGGSVGLPCGQVAQGHSASILAGWWARPT